LLLCSYERMVPQGLELRTGEMEQRLQQVSSIFRNCLSLLFETDEDELVWRKEPRARTGQYTCSDVQAVFEHANEQETGPSGAHIESLAHSLRTGGGQHRDGTGCAFCSRQDLYVAAKAWLASAVLPQYAHWTGTRIRGVSLRVHSSVTCSVCWGVGHGNLT